MLKRCFLCFVLLVFCSFHALAQNELTETYLTIRDKLVSLKQESAIMSEQLLSMSEQLAERSQSLRASESERTALVEQSRKLSNSLMTINGQLNACYETITELRHQLEVRTIVVTVLIILLFLRVLGMLLGYILYAKGVKLPRWLDILL